MALSARLASNASAAASGRGAATPPPALPRGPAPPRSAAAPRAGRAAAPCGAAGRGACLAVRAAGTKAQEAQLRWTQQVKDGSVMNVSNKSAGELMKEGWVLLDVRPPGEVAKVGITGAVNVPLYVEDPSNSVGSLLKKSATIGTGGWWLGGTHMIPNNDFMAQVAAQVPKDTPVIVACQKGLRSLAAAEQLSRAGYQKLAWINGGLDTARPGDLPTTNGRDVRYAGIGGLSEALGWTEVQQEEGAGGFMGGVQNIFKIVALVLAADLALFAYEQVTYMTSAGGHSSSNSAQRRRWALSPLPARAPLRHRGLRKLDGRSIGCATHAMLPGGLQRGGRCQAAAGAGAPARPRLAAAQRRAGVSAVSARSAAFGQQLRGGAANGRRWAMGRWLDNRAEVEVPVPLEVCWALWDDRARIPQWMPWIKSVAVQADNPALSRWTLATHQFGRDWEFSWLARNLAPVRNQKLHWVSEPGSASMGLNINNRGQIRFVRRPLGCVVSLSISYEVPEVLAPFANALTPVVEGVIGGDMQRFRQYAISYAAAQASSQQAPRA
ncbi:STR11 [Scenedesmus sp. PABB004]|nr:STR11 [Scenedesmus sp. PABB004]